MAPFALLMLLASPALSLFASTAICLAVIALDLARGRSIKILAAGSALVFAGLGVWLVLVDPQLKSSAIRLAVDAGVLAVALCSVLIRRPFTLQYATESVPAETAAMPGFLRANYAITGAWTAATALMMAGNFATVYVPGLPLWSSLLIAFAARYSAIYFTKWYPQYQKIKHAGAAPAAGVMQGS